MARAALGPEALPVKLLIRALVHQILRPDPHPFHAALDETVQEIERHCNGKQTPPRGYRTLKDTYGRARKILNDALIESGEEPLPLRPLFASTLEPHPDPQDISLMAEAPPRRPLTKADEDVLREMLEASAQDPDFKLFITEDGEVLDGVVDDDDLSILDGPPIMDAETTHASQLIQYAIHELLPKFARRNTGRPGLARYVHEGVLYFIVLTEQGVLPGGEKFTLNFTVEPYKTFMRASEDVILCTGSGKHAHAKLVDPDDSAHKYWAQFIYHKPGRKLRFFGSRQLVDGGWLDVPSATSYIVMTADRPYYKVVSLDEFRSLPTID
jgi:hypothetical protein